MHWQTKVPLKRPKGDEKLYHEIFRQQQQLGIIEMVPKWTPYLIFTSSGSSDPPKSTSELHVVFDASAKDERGNSLNSQLLRDLLNAKDHDTTLFLWVKEKGPIEENNAEVYRFCTVPFGMI
uniref:Chromo domain-containing protein n=1 Tax=Ascaris lumbricoides TaxID=6252 RepID=A0A0M3HS76_ASCLU